MNPVLTAEEMKKVDQLMVAKYHVEVLQLMEMAGFQVAQEVRKYARRLSKNRILILSGKGGNGGDSLVAAKYLRNWGFKVEVILGSLVSELKGVPAKQWAILQSLKIPAKEYQKANLEKSFKKAEIIIDGLLGFSASGSPKSPLDLLIRQANQSKKPLIAIDVPSGLDSTTGETPGEVISADFTLTLGCLKTGFFKNKAKRYTGKIKVLDIGIPEEVYRER